MNISLGLSSSADGWNDNVNVQFARSKVYESGIPAVTIGDGRTNDSIALDPFSRCVWWVNVNAISFGMGSSPWTSMGRIYGSCGLCGLMTFSSLKGVGGSGDSSSLLQIERSSPSH